MKTEFSVIFAFLLGSIHAWNSHTHLMVARMAYDELMEVAPEVVDQANAILAVLEESQPDITYYEDKHPFVECTTLADTMKYKGWGWQSNWHYDDIPYYDEGGAPEDYPDFVYDDLNITVRLQHLVDWLSNADGYKETDSYKVITGHYNEEESRSIALRLLIHLYGDIHQPCHSESRVDDEYPKGDKGANDFPLKYHYDVDELHALWDTVIYENHNSVHLPFDDDSWTDFGAETALFISKFIITDEEIEMQDFATIAQESYEIAVDTVYENIYMDEPVPQEYIDKNLPIAERQVILGGRRLAYMLKKIYASNAVVSEEPNLFLQ